MTRGIDGMDMFKDDNDRVFFLSLFEKYTAQSQVRCYAWVLMKNHYHLVLMTSEKPLSSLMKPLNSGYARYFNKKVGRKGYLFQDRFKSVATQDQLYLEEMIRYVHLNPIRAGICKDIAELDSFRWCGHAVLMGKRIYEFQDTSVVLRRFGKTAGDARKKYRQFLLAGLNSGDNAFIEQVRTSSGGSSDRNEPAMWVIGDREFIRQCISRDENRRLMLARYKRDGWDMERLSSHVASALKINPKDIRHRGRSNVRSSARKIVSYLAYRRLGIPMSAIARFFGVVQSAASVMAAKGDELAGKHGIDISD
jgi:REP element-mobilizing transposase RayT